MGTLLEFRVTISLHSSLFSNWPEQTADICRYCITRTCSPCIHALFTAQREWWEVEESVGEVGGGQLERSGKS
jgi:hypothetical protein